MKVVTKLGIGYGAFLGLLIVLLSYQLSIIRELVDANRALSESSSRVAASSSHLLTLADELTETARKYTLLDEDEGYAEQFRRTASSFADTLRHFQTLPLTAEETEAVERVEDAWTAFLAGRPLEAGLEPESVGELKVRTQHLRGASERAMLAAIDASTRSARTADRLSIAAVVAGLFLSVLLSALIVRSISGSLRRLTAGTQAVADGDFSVRLSETARDEFGQVAHAFNVMTGKLGEAEKTKRNFLSSVSHDLKSPLASMQETTRLLLDELAGEISEEQRRLLELSHGSGERLSGLIASLLDLARMEAGAMEYDFENTDLVQLGRRVVGRSDLRAAAKGSRIDASWPDQPVTVRCDVSRFEQVVENLLGNAIKFSPPGSVIEVALGQPEVGAPMSLSVADRGPGVAEHEKALIFDRFYQTETSAPFAGTGVGLGLAISSEIAAAHGATIEVADNPGGGSVFTVHLSGMQVPDDVHAEAAEAVASGVTGGAE